MEASQFNKTEPNKLQSIILDNEKNITPKSNIPRDSSQMKVEVTHYIQGLGNKHNKQFRVNDKTITNENTNHFVINSQELPKGLVLSSLE